KLYALDQMINDTGVYVELPLIEGAICIKKEALSRANRKVEKATDGAITTVNQTAAIKAFLQQWVPGLPGVSKAVLAAIPQDTLPHTAKEVIEARQDTARASTNKFDSMKLYADPYGILRGLLQFNGAMTGRWAGRGPQFQNLPRQSFPVDDFL